MFLLIIDYLNISHYFLINLLAIFFPAATPPQVYPFIKKDEQGYRYFEKNLLEMGGKVDSPVTFKYHLLYCHFLIFRLPLIKSN